MSTVKLVNSKTPDRFGGQPRSLVNCEGRPYQFAREKREWFGEP